MNYLNLRVADLLSWEYRSSKNPQKLAWVRLLIYCVGQENGGTIENASDWNDAQWRDIVGISLAQTRAKTPLYGWKGKVLHVLFYPKDQERVHKAKSAAARSTNDKRWGKRHASPTGSESLSDSVSQSPEATLSESIKEGKGRVKESKGREESTCPSLSDASLPTEEEVRTWAAGPAGVDPDYAASRWASANEKHQWLNSHQQLINWRARFLRFWTEDREAWMAKKKSRPAATAAAEPDDKPEWWSMPFAELDGLLQGALRPPQHPRLERLREIWSIRSAHPNR